MEFVPNEKATPIRYPSIANLMVDSYDRDDNVYPTSNDFQINKKNSILNGFFTRIGATEVVMEWNTPNISASLGNNQVNYTVDGTLYQLVIPSGFYTCEKAIDEIGDTLELPSASTGVTWVSQPLVGAGATLTATGPPGTLISVTGLLFNQLNQNGLVGVIAPNGELVFEILASTADLRPARYVDIVSNQLTNNQAVKDASTAENVRDVLVRWYFDFDNQTPTDGYGFPILMGYTPFYLRRLYNPPKQIQWQTNVPIGNLSFQLYRNDGTLMPVNFNTNYLMTLQVSEV
jgi:hypothetical protein